MRYHNAAGKVDEHDRAILLIMSMLRDARQVWLSRGATGRCGELTRLRVLYRYIRAQNKGTVDLYRKPDLMYPMTAEVAYALGASTAKTLKVKS